ncbi:MAG: nucleotidyltransferase domain-containing protein [Candidatus Aenigmarchaeota archaeon]|nr:nucleotidyltransferase domain-containing protein [Candidatus Aenigmarchaeota archaeon]
MIEKFPLLKILNVLRDQKEYSIRGIAKKTGIGVATAKTYMDYLSSKKIMKKKVVGRSHFYSFDISNFLAKSIKVTFSLSEINESGIVSELLAKCPITSIVLYGSVARGEDDLGSDIDMLIITRKKHKIASLRSEKKLKRELALLSYTMQEWRSKSKEDKVFYDRVIIDGIPLYGEMPVMS